ncbi:HupE/UreJ family protein [Myceligenerans pegani]|uniref:HupE/UreJ family protein n=1 Tax=Myceligenerans pegani TaxID=2776917 RepID=A0ABR9MUK0_9MICO|nr:HupE/UreJ family protein [Myceligenerans sp. TRM 65318]MBE1875053.1 HupE/UreJ family protein [Myceligenerans sp. TRM 65318]MBE3017324.1 HupE/UreJ family protein [Myceligenerans sp. TRM 65318]
MKNPPIRRVTAAFAAAVTAVLATLLPTTAAAHSLTSSTISVRTAEDGADATVSVAAQTLEDAIGTLDANAVVDYLDEHLAVTGADGAEWGETWGDVTYETVEGIESVSVDVAFDTGGADGSDLVLSYDGIIEADSGHEAVVVLTDAAGDVSTAGVITGSEPSVAIGDASLDVASTSSAGVLDMIGYGFHHVLEGADHLLFLVTLLLVAPMVAVAGRWRPRAGAGGTVKGLLAVVTAFTVGHTITLIAAATGWVSFPSGPIEVLVGASIGVAGIHAIRPLVHQGEALVAGGFGLVHGLAFAGILADLGLSGSTSVLNLLAFNLGVELSQLAVVVLVFPSLWVLARSSWSTPVRLSGASVALVMAAAWVLDRLGVLANPLAGVETAVVAHPWMVALGLLVLAGVAWAADSRRPADGRLGGGRAREVVIQE